MKNLVSKSIKACLVLTAFNFCLFSYSEEINTAKGDMETQEELNAQLLEAVEAGEQIDEVSKLLKLGADANAKNKWGQTALHVGSRWGNIETVRLLIDNGADVNAKNKWGQTALHVGSRWGNIETVRLLVDNGADVNVEDYDGWTPIQMALGKRFPGKKFPEIVQILEEAGAEKNLFKVCITKEFCLSL